MVRYDTLLRDDQQQHTEMARRLIRRERITVLGLLGEQLAAAALTANGFEGVRNLNDDRTNFPFADLIAEKDGKRFFIGVKARNEIRADGRRLNESYNMVLINDALNRELKRHGKTASEITAMLLDVVHERAAAFKAEAAWMTVPMRPLEGTYAVYFGLVRKLGMKRSIPMTHRARDKYLLLRDWVHDPRIQASLVNT